MGDGMRKDGALLTCSGQEDDAVTPDERRRRWKNGKKLESQSDYNDRCAANPEVLSPLDRHLPFISV